MGMVRSPKSLAAASTFSALRPQITAVAPSRTNAFAMALPMPRLPPVMIATFPSSCMFFRLTSEYRCAMEQLDHQMFREPDNVPRVPLANFRDQIWWQLVQFFFEEAAVGIG